MYRYIAKNKASYSHLDQDTYPVELFRNAVGPDRDSLIQRKPIFNKNLMPTINLNYLLDDLIGDLVGRKFGLDDEVMVGEAVEILPLVKEFFCRFLASGERAFFSRVTDIEPAVFERGLEPDAFVTVLFDQIAIVGKRPRAAAERKDTAGAVGKGIFQAVALDASKFLDPDAVDNAGDRLADMILDLAVEVDPATVEEVSEVPGDARFADSHEAGQRNADFGPVDHKITL
jgi:hypothetical protein